jgi:hypothetical protein
MRSNSRSLLMRIQDLLDGKLGHEHAEKTAADYNLFCERLQSRIEHFSKLIEEGNYYAALDLARIEPKLTTQMERIRFPRESEWRSLLHQLGVPCFPGFDDLALKRVREICADQSFRQPSAYRDYRKAILLKDRTAAITSLHQLHSTYPKDRNATHELMRLEKEELESIEQTLARLLRTKKDEAVIDLVRNTIEKKWLIPLAGKAWDQAFERYNAHQRQKQLEALRQAIAQVKVIRRVGNWRDAAPAIDRFIQAQNTVLPESLQPSEQEEMNQSLAWYQQLEAEDRQLHQHRQSFDLWLQRLQPITHTPAQFQNEPTRKLHQLTRELELEWQHFQSLVPSLCADHAPTYRLAQARLQAMLASRDQSRFPRKIVWWAAAIPLVAVMAVPAYWINRQESNLSSRATEAYSTRNLANARVALADWEDFTTRYHSRHNPFRNYIAHRQVQEVAAWIQELDLRQAKISELLDRVEQSLRSPLERPELRRTQLNLGIAADLLEKLRTDLGTTLLHERYENLQAKAIQSNSAHLEGLRQEILSDMEALDLAFRQTFPTRKSDFSSIEDELRSLRLRIQAIEASLLQSFRPEDVQDLRERLQPTKEQLEVLQQAHQQLLTHQTRMQGSIALSEYLENLRILGDLPFPAHPLVRHAQDRVNHREQFENLAQQLLLPGNRIAWVQFLKRVDAPLVAEGLDPKEATPWRVLSNQAPLRNIHRYRVLEYRNGLADESFRWIHTNGEAALTTERAQTTGRTVFTVQEFDEPSIGQGVPFRERVYTCETDANGNPFNGPWLQHDRLTPESAFYREIVAICGFDAASQSFRKPLLEVLDTIRAEPFLSPIFKAWITQELFNILVVRPFDWGLNFCPSAQIDYKQLSSFKGTLFPFDWLRSSTQNRLLQPLQEHYESQQPISYHRQALASRELFKQVSRQRVRFAGYADDTGTFHLLSSTPDDRQLFGMREDGTMDLLRSIVPRDGTSPRTYRAMPYSPILFFNDPPQAILDRVSRNVGLDVRSSNFRPFLPPIFQD